MKSNNSAVLMRILTVPSQLRTHTWNIKTVCTNKLKKYFPLLSLASSGRFLERIIAIYRGSDMLFLSGCPVSGDLYICRGVSGGSVLMVYLW